MIRTPRNNSANKAVTGINITPFTDVCLVLLIIFLLTATDLNKTPDKGKEIPLPTSDTYETMPSQPIIIEIDRAENLFLNGKLVSFSTLASELNALFIEFPLAENDERIVVIKADKKIAYENVIKTMDIAGSVGSSTIMLGVDDNNSNSETANANTNTL